MFLYYLPGSSKPADCGLGYALDLQAGTYQTRPILRGGPDGGSGVIVCDNAVRDVGYFPERQTWQEIVGGNGAWLGWSQLPGSYELARTNLLQGSEIELADGSRWTVPLARSPSMESGELRYTIALPRSLVYRSDGWVYGPVERAYQRLFQIAEDWLSARFAAESEDGEQTKVELTTDEAIGWSVEVLSFNYRIGKAEASALQMFNQYNWHRVLDSTVDYDRLVALLQKKTDVQLTAELETTTAGSAV